MKHVTILHTMVCVITFYGIGGVHNTLYAPQPLPQSFDELVMVLVPEESQEPFRLYYRNKLDQLKLITSPTSKKKQIAQLKKNAYYALEVHHPKWAHEVAPVLTLTSAQLSEQQRTANNFLIQYGIYLTYVRQTATQKGSMWTKVNSKKETVKSKVGSWIGKMREKKNTSRRIVA